MTLKMTVFQQVWQHESLASDLPLPVDADDAVGCLVGRRDEYGVPADAVHKDARAIFDVVKVHVAVFGNEIDHVVLFAHLCTT